MELANSFLFTSESVSEGHPDKVADQISDAILDAIFAQDPRSRVAAETLTNTGLVVLAGEITTNATVDYIQVARDTLKRIGYDNTEYGIDHKGCVLGLLFQVRAQHVDHAEQRARGETICRGQFPPLRLDGVIGTIEIVVTVNQYESGHGRILPPCSPALSVAGA